MLGTALDALGWIASLGVDAGIWASGGGAAIGVSSFLLRSRAGKFAMIGLAGGLMLLGSYVAGRLHEKAENRRDQLEAKIIALEFELRTAHELAQLGFDQMRRQEARATERDQLQKDYDAQLATQPAEKSRACALDLIDVRWLCQLRGGC